MTSVSKLRRENYFCGLRQRDPLRFSDEALASGTRVAARIEYHGGGYHGWQAQPHLNVATVQGTLEAALSSVAGVNVTTTCAGRTDTGVHGYSQIIHFDDFAGRSIKAWVMGTNRHLPDDVRVHWATSVSSDFHARFSATERSYRYIICNTPTKPAALNRLVTWYRHTLNLDLMNEACHTLRGEQDFSAFRAASCQAKTPHRRINRCYVERHGRLVVVNISANAFLHHMVRNIVGSLLAVGAGLRTVEWFESVLARRDRTLAAETAPPDGLYLTAVSYPPEFELPDTPEGPTLLTGHL